MSSTIETDGVPASLLMSDARCPALTLIFSTQFAGKKKSAVELTADVAGSTILTRTPPVDDTEPGKLSDSSFQPRRSPTRSRAISAMLVNLRILTFGIGFLFGMGFGHQRFDKVGSRQMTGRNIGAVGLCLRRNLLVH
ncbi:MAG: hypothetical protein WAM50_00105 [Pseudolabrys sp.]